MYRVERKVCFVTVTDEFYNFDLMEIHLNSKNLFFALYSTRREYRTFPRNRKMAREFFNHPTLQTRATLQLFHKDPIYISIMLTVNFIIDATTIMH